MRRMVTGKRIFFINDSFRIGRMVFVSVHADRTDRLAVLRYMITPRPRVKRGVMHIRRGTDSIQ